MKRSKDLVLSPLGFSSIPQRWTTAVQDVIQSTQAAALIAIAAVRESRHLKRDIAYARSSKPYSTLPKRYRHKAFSWRHIVSAVDSLVDAGLIEDSPSRPGFYGQRSTLVADDRLIELLDPIVPRSRLQFQRNTEIILLRGKDENGNKTFLDYKDTARTRKMRDDLRAQNELADAATILDGEGNDVGGPLVRIFKNDLRSFGRMYARGDSWQNLRNRTGERQLITIDRAAVVEIDYSSQTPSMLRLERGLPVLVDCYTIDGWDKSVLDLRTGRMVNVSRNLAKIGVQCLLNSKSRPGAVGALAGSEAMDEFAPEADDKERYSIANAMITDLMRFHHEIADCFFTGVSARLQMADSNIANDVLKICRKSNVLALPIHDSFLVQERHKDILMASMDEAAHKHGYRGLLFKVSQR